MGPHQTIANHLKSLLEQLKTSEDDRAETTICGMIVRARVTCINTKKRTFYEYRAPWETEFHEVRTADLLDFLWKRSSLLEIELMKTSTKQETIETKTIELSGADLAAILRRSTYFQNLAMVNVDNSHAIAVTFEVPTGGDYSGDVLNITEQLPVKITLTRKTVNDEA